MFAIVDIETTGGHAGANNITEIAIVLHNGQEVEGKFSTLVNPGMPIQKYVQALTGISSTADGRPSRTTGASSERLEGA